MKTFWTLPAAALLLAGCGEMMMGEVGTDILPALVDEINQNGTHEIAKQIPGATIKARLEGDDLLVLMVGNVPTGNQTYDPNALRRLMRGEVCKDRHLAELIRNGGKLRIEMTSNFGKELPAIQFARC